MSWKPLSELQPSYLSVSAPARRERSGRPLASGICCSHHRPESELIVENSAVPAVTAHWVKRTILRYARHGENNGDSQVAFDFDVASNPEFLEEGVAISNLFRPDRISAG
jgi:UDPglucose 6-dehydrogenase